MQQALSFERTQELLGKIRIPSAPSILVELHEIMQVDEPDLGLVADAVGRDVAIAALVLKTVNSSFFGLKQQVSSIRQATALLGLLNVSNIVAGLALKRAMDEQGGELPPEFWDSPVNIANLAAMLAQRYGGIQPDEAYMLGLFKNAGEVLMMQRFDDYVGVLNEARNQGGCQVALEEARYNTNHTVVGYYISSSWGLPQHISDIILRHHDATNFLTEDDSAMSLPRTLMAVLSYVGVSSTEFLDVTDDMVEMLLLAQE